MTEHPPHAPRRDIRTLLARRIPVLALLCVAGLLLPLLSQTLAGTTGRLVWLIDLASHWQWLFLAGLLVLGGLSVWLNRRWIWLFAVVPAPWLTASVPVPSVEPGGAVFTVASANLFFQNRDLQPLTRWVAETRPDVLVLLEVAPEFAGHLVALRDYPYQYVLPENSPFGIAVLSRHVLSQTQAIRDAQGIARIEAQVQWRDESVRLIAWHPMPPLSPEIQATRDDTLRTLAQDARRSGQPVVLAGDLNATPWSSAFSGLAAQGLQRASGLAPSWPAAGGGLFGIPIDHVLVTPHWGLVSSEVGPDLGSDHFPVLVRLALDGAQTRRAGAVAAGAVPAAHAEPR